MLSLASFLDTFFPKEESETSYLIQVQKALENVPSTNDFYKSIDDPIFLEECLRFMRLAKTFSQSTWPAGTKKEKDLKVILNLLKDLELGQSEGSIPSLRMSLYLTYTLFGMGCFMGRTAPSSWRKMVGLQTNINSPKLCFPRYAA